MLAIWTIVCQTNLPLDHSFRALQAIYSSHRHARATMISPLCADHVCSAHGMPAEPLPFRRRTHVCPQVEFFWHSSSSSSFVSDTSTFSLLYLRALASAGAAAAITQVGRH